MLFFFFTDDGEMFIQDSMGIINIEEKPVWLEEEKYNFDWNKIKNLDEPYINMKFE